MNIFSTSRKAVAFFGGLMVFLLAGGVKAQDRPQPQHYTEIDYSQTITVGGAAVTGKLSSAAGTVQDWYDNVVIATGLSFNAKAGKGYLITVKYQPADYGVWQSGASYGILTGGDLVGDWNDVISQKEVWGYGSGTLTIIDHFTSQTDDTFRILLLGYAQNELNYTITIEERDFIHLMAVDYSRIITVNGNAVTGKLSENLVINYFNQPVTAAGLSFNAVTGKRYRIRVNYQNTDFETIRGWYDIMAVRDRGGETIYSLINSFNGSGYETVDVIGNFMSDETGIVRILLYNTELKELNYTVTVEEVKLYSDLDYSQTITVNGSATTGTLSEERMVDHWGQTFTAAGLSFNAVAGKIYKISIKYLAGTVNTGVGYSILKGGNLVNSSSDVIDNKWGITGYFESPETGLLRILLWNHDRNHLNYTVAIEEVNVISYTGLDYFENKIIVNAPAVTGKLSGSVDYSGTIMPAAGFSFDAVTGKTYSVNIKYKFGTNVQVGYHILTGGDLVGDWNDVIYEKTDWGYGSGTLTVIGHFTSPETGQLRVLLYDRNLNELDYTITIEEVISYTELNYSNTITVGGSEVKGKLSQSVIYLKQWEYSDNNTVTASDLSFQAQEGKIYKVTVKYESNTPVNMGTGYSILKSGTLAGNDDDVISRYERSNYGTEFTVSWYFTSPKTDLLRVLLWDYNWNELNYTVTIEDADNISYTALDYSQTITVNGAATAGKLSSRVIQNWNKEIRTANTAGLSFDAVEGKSYLITIMFPANPTTSYASAECWILTSKNLTGTSSDILSSGGQGFISGSPFYGVGALTVTRTFRSTETGKLRVLLNGSEQDYNVTIEEIILYTDLNYSQAVTVDGSVVTGKLSKELVSDPWPSSVATAAGLSFNAKAGERYIITVRYQAQESNVFIGAYYRILTGGNLVGNSDDIINSVISNNGWGTVTATGNFTWPTDGTFRILLQDPRRNELDYTITIEKLISHTELNFSAKEEVTLNAPAVEGALSEPVYLDFHNNWSGHLAHESFPAEAGKTYNITVTYQADENVTINPGYFILPSEDLTGNNSNAVNYQANKGVYMSSGHFIQTSGNVAANSGDFIDDNWGYGTGTVTVSGTFTSPTNGTFPVLLLDNNGNSLKYYFHVATPHDCNDNIDWSAEKTVIRAANCTQPGRKAHVCSFCKLEHDAEVIGALGHNLVWNITTPATCLSAAVETNACNRLNCTHTAGTRNSPTALALDHILENVTAISETCTNTGRTAGVQCTRLNCTHNTSTLIAALGHTLENVTALSPTCTNAGRTEGVRCTRTNCTHNTSESIAVLGHNLVWNVTAQATCLLAAVETHTCNRANCAHTEGARAGAAALGHSFGDWTVKTPATETAEGVRERVCTRPSCTVSETGSIDKVSILSFNRIITNPQNKNGNDAAEPVSVLPNEFTAGPNPVLRSAGAVNFYWQGNGINSAKLFIYDASGNLIKRIDIRDNTIGKSERREVGSWDFKDSKGRLISEGTYVVKGNLTVRDGKKEKVSLILGVR